MPAADFAVGQGMSRKLSEENGTMSKPNDIEVDFAGKPITRGLLDALDSSLKRIEHLRQVHKDAGLYKDKESEIKFYREQCIAAGFDSDYVPPELQPEPIAHLQFTAEITDEHLLGL
jgi:hypothetical protein